MREGTGSPIARPRFRDAGAAGRGLIARPLASSLLWDGKSPRTLDTGAVMLRDPKVIEHLNIQLTNELTAVNQYFLHARTLQHWGVTKLAKQEYDESIGEMKHADELIKRILFLDGLPNVQRLNSILVGEDVEQILRADQALEERALADLREGIAHCESVREFCLPRPIAAHPGKRGRTCRLPRSSI